MKFKIGDRVKLKRKITLIQLQNCGTTVKHNKVYTIVDISLPSPPLYKLSGANYISESYLQKIIVLPKW
jgi:hypothetical protein